jgi:hypothetical protein
MPILSCRLLDMQRLSRDTHRTPERRFARAGPRHFITVAMMLSLLCNVSVSETNRERYHCRP